MHSAPSNLMAEKILVPLKDKVNRNVKDSVFVDLFGQSQYLLQLYQVFHPEDTVTTADDLTIVTLENLFLKERYNDLGFMVGNKLMMLVEAQSSWSVNLVIRFLLYIADTYNRYIENNNLNLYTSRKIDLPVPELYVIYTGRRQNCPQYISFRKDILGQKDSAVEVKARVLQSSIRKDILSQYISFTRIFDEQMVKYGKTRRAVQETLRICQEQDVLAAYLAKEEAATIMFTLIDKEKQLERYVREEREEARNEGHIEGRIEGFTEGREEGCMEGLAKGREEMILASLPKLMTCFKISARQALDALGIPASEQGKYLSRL